MTAGSSVGTLSSTEQRQLKRFEPESLRTLKLGGYRADTEALTARMASIGTSGVCHTVYVGLLGEPVASTT